MTTMIPYVILFIFPALAMIFVHIHQSVSRKLAELQQEALANVHKELLEQEIFERQLENRQEEAYYRALSEEITKHDKKNDVPEIVTQLNGKTIHGSISVSADGVTIKADGIDVGHIAPFSSIDAGHIAPASSIEDVLMEKVEKKLAALGNSIVKESTNCPNCGAALSGHVCKYCGTHA